MTYLQVREQILDILTGERTVIGRKQMTGHILDPSR
jgi:hypothetical protein